MSSEPRKDEFASGGAGEFRGLPMHQPPNPEDLRRVPPAGPVCARIRGLLRDFADGDLEAGPHREVEEHVHACFACSVELSRAEHEVLRLRRGYARIALAESRQETSLPADFADRVVDRILDGVADRRGPGSVTAGGSVADDPAERGVDGRTGANGGAPPRDGDPRPNGAQPGRPSVAGAGRRGDAAGVHPSRDGAARRRRAGQALLLAATLLLTCFAALAMWNVGKEQRPERSARLVVQSARKAYGDLGRLFVGDGLGERDRLKVAPGGSARVDWHDRSGDTQPAATLALRGEARVRLEEGAPVLEAGVLSIETKRPVTIPIADGSEVELGVGDYVIFAEVPLSAEDYLPPMLDPLASAPADLRVQIEVLRGDPARVVRSSDVGPTLIAAGNVGVYEGGSSVATHSGGVQVANTAAGPRGNAPAAPALPQVPTMSATVLQRSGLPSVGTLVLATYPANGVAMPRYGVTDAYGKVVITSDFACASNFAIVQALPLQPAYGFVAPDAVRVLRNDVHTRIEHAIVTDLAVPVDGQVVDPNGQPLLGVRVMPCIVDELLGNVYSLFNLSRSSDEFGRFRIDQLSPRLPHHQHLALLLLHPEWKPKVVPLPVRSGPNASQPLAPIVMPALQQVIFWGLPIEYAGDTLTLWEDIESMPSRAAWQRTISYDGSGGVAAHVGGGELYAMLPNGMCRKFRFSEAGGILTANLDPPSPYESLFRQQMVNVPGTDLYVCSHMRHENPEAPSTSSGGLTLIARDGLGRLVPGAQVFASRTDTPRSLPEGRFLGMTTSQGVLAIDPVHAGNDLVVLGPGGEVSFVSQLPPGASVAEVQLEATGRVLIGETLRPDPIDGEAVVRVQLRRQFQNLPSGNDFVAERFASQATGWEIGGIVPGFYTVELNGQTRPVVVPSDGFVVLQ